MKLKYDLHIHSCLSPCGDNSMTPATIAGLAKLEELDVIALCDHNSSLNCGAFMRAAEFYEMPALCGMELTTSEDIHVLCLFDTLKKAMAFHEYVQSQRSEFPNNPKIFGEQLIVDETDEIKGTVDGLLITASDIGFNDVGSLVREFGGVAVPAHIDKTSDSALSTLGEIPLEAGFCTYEIYRKGEPASDKSDKIEEKAKLLVPETLIKPRFIINSDAHMPEDIGIVGSVLEIPDEDIEKYGSIPSAVLNWLRNKIP